MIDRLIVGELVGEFRSLCPIGQNAESPDRGGCGRAHEFAFADFSTLAIPSLNRVVLGSGSTRKTRSDPQLVIDSTVDASRPQSFSAER